MDRRSKGGQPEFFFLTTNQIKNMKPEIIVTPESLEIALTEQMFEAIKVGNIALAVRIANINAIGEGGKTFLMKVCEAASVTEEVFSRLIAAGADVNIKTQDGITALMLACKAGQTKKCEILINAKARLDEISREGKTALIYAIEHYELNDSDYIETIELLVQRRADVNIGKDVSESNPLMMVARSLDPRASILLIGANARVNEVREDGWTALLLAVDSYKDLAPEYDYALIDNILEALIAAGADVNATLPDGMTVLMLACSFGTPEGVEKLIADGADFSAVNADGKTALDIAIKRMRRGKIWLEETVKISKIITFLKRAIDEIEASVGNGGGGSGMGAAAEPVSLVEDVVSAVTEAEKAELTAQMLEFMEGEDKNIELAARIATIGADINAALPDGTTPLILVADSYQKSPPKDYEKIDKTLKVLINAKADVNAALLDGTTALMLVCSFAASTAVSALIAAGARVNEVRESDGATALIAAADSYQENGVENYKNIDEILEVLIAAGADVNAALPDGTTALMLACSFGTSQAVAMLIAAGANVNLGFSDGTTALNLAIRRIHKSHRSDDDIIEVAKIITDIEEARDKFELQAAAFAALAEAEVAASASNSGGGSGMVEPATSMSVATGHGASANTHNRRTEEDPDFSPTGSAARVLSPGNNGRGHS